MLYSLMQECIHPNFSITLNILETSAICAMPVRRFGLRIRCAETFLSLP